MMLSPGLLVASFATCAAAQTASIHSLQTTIPWSPKAASSVDQSIVYNDTYYLADRTNAGVHIISLINNTQINLITGFATVLVNGSVSSASSGPNGLVVLPDRNQLWVGDGDGSVKVIDLVTQKIIQSIATGSKYRADEFAYDAKSGVVLVSNPNDTPPFVTAMSASNRSVIGQFNFTDVPGELEQPAFNPTTGLFYISVPESDANKGGEIRSLTLANFSTHTVYPLPPCIPAGIAFGPNQHLFVSCSQDQILDYNYASAFVLDIANGGKVIANVTGVAGSDQVAYNSAAGLYYMSAYQNQAGGLKTGLAQPYLSIIDATTNVIIQNITTDNKTAHS
ncbi:hypothetical protein LTR17_027663 [Elasticomyces elasticus]|nr:hypothetical protein LTR17_027663 [Elasticomyces elasticus]